MSGGYGVYDNSKMPAEEFGVNGVDEGEKPGDRVPGPPDQIPPPRQFGELVNEWGIVGNLLPPPAPPLPMINGDPPAAQLYSADPGNGQPHIPWINVDQAGNLYVYGNLVAPASSTTVVPSGDTTGAQDVATIQALINQGNINITLGTGQFYINQPLVIQTNGVRIHGSGGATASGNDASFNLGTRIVITAGFTNPNSWSGLVTAAITIIQHNPGGGSGGADPAGNQINGTRLKDFWIDGTSSPATVDGIAQFGNIEAAQYERVGCYNITGKAFPCYSDTSWASGSFPDGQHLYSCVAQRCHDHAFYGSYVDATFMDCHAQSSNLTGVGYGDGFYITGGHNFFVACRSDLNQNGFTFDVPTSVGSNSFLSEAVMMVGSGTQLNNNNGLNVINSSVTGNSTRAFVLLSGCNFEGDGTNGGAGGGGFAGIHVEGRNVVIGSNVFVTVYTVGAPGVGSPAYAISTAVSGSGNAVPDIIQLTGGFLVAVTATLNDTAPATFLDLSPTTRAYVGGEYASNAGTPSVLLNQAKMGATSITLNGSTTALGAPLVSCTNTVSGSVQPQVSMTAQASGDIILGGRVAGDTNNRLRMESSGLLKWGPGNATQDAFLQRGAAGQLQISTTNVAGVAKTLDPYFGGQGFLQETNALSIGNALRPSYTVATAGLTTSGTIYLVSVYISCGTTIGHLSMLTGTGTLKTGGQHGWYILADQNLVIRAATADQTDAATVWGTASTVYTLAIANAGGSAASTFTTTYSGLYYIGVMVANSSGTQPNLVATAAPATGVPGTVGNAISGNCTGGSGTSQTTPPATDGSVTLTLASDGTKNFIAWAT